ncbi:ribonuclease E activity regulator RraA [Chengkuizengella sediminis]|uniref:ribonuclease E activity regulator RraA n=1 Tax=Chengkuizengella sediminis TaxID=1885917 RepID=UPI00138A49AE|nr:ribonuclease E activity regulator RraA [Chengkuizengella sediminis]NDI35128.1 RraA family protein [Chengkuizengella sediminis]
MTFKTTDLCDEYAKELSICQTEFRSFGKKQSFFGPIATVEILEDNVLLEEALNTIPEGSVLVVDGGGSKKCALMGDRLGEIGVSRRLSGIIINGCVRDSVELSKLDFGIRALSTNPLKSKKEGKGKTNVVVKFGEVTWVPGEYVYVDEDGIVVAPRELS